MPSETPTEGRCNYELDGGYCKRHPMDNGLCYVHGGKNYPTNGGAPEKNQNAREHGAYATTEFLIHDLPEKHEDTFHATHEALCTRYETMIGREPDYAAKKRLSQYAGMIVQQDLIKEYMQEQAINEDIPLTEVQLRDIDGRIEVEAVNKLLPYLVDFSREVRLGLKDMGMTFSPEKQSADAERTLVELLKED